MKLRIKGNSLRLRLTKSEVKKLADEGHLEEQTNFTGSKLVYELQSVNTATELSAVFENNKITIYIPNTFAKSWVHNDVIGINTNMQTDGGETLFILIEKDFICLDETTEDQSDNFVNPNKTC